MSYWARVIKNIGSRIQPGWSANAAAATFLAILKTIKPRADVARQNIAIAFPGKSQQEREKILSESYENMIWTGLEFFAWQKNPACIKNWIVEVEGEHHLDAAREAGKGTIIMTPHLGNWELEAAWLAQYHGPITAIVRHSDSPFQKELIESLRRISGLKTMDKREPMTRAVGILKRNESLGILPDQHGGSEGIMVPFFGVETSTVAGPAVFAVLTKAPIISVQIIRLAPFRFKIIIDAPLEWTKGPDRDTTIRDLTITVNKQVEKMIKRAPGQWLWQHRRFREIES